MMIKFLVLLLKETIAFPFLLPLPHLLLRLT
jgi:hypothetical protein